MYRSFSAWRAVLAVPCRRYGGQQRLCGADTHLQTEERRDRGIKRVSLKGQLSHSLTGKYRHMVTSEQSTEQTDAHMTGRHDSTQTGADLAVTLTVSAACSRRGQNQQPARLEQPRGHRCHLPGVRSGVEQIGAKHDVELSLRLRAVVCRVCSWLGCRTGAARPGRIIIPVHP